MDYETYIDIKQYSPNSTVYFTLRVTDVLNMDYYYDGSAVRYEAAHNPNATELVRRLYLMTEAQKTSF
jgi:hypothetical protein